MEEQPTYRTERRQPPGFERLFAPASPPPDLAVDPFADNCVHLDYKTLCHVVKALAERVTALEARLGPFKPSPVSGQLALVWDADAAQLVAQLTEPTSPEVQS